MVHFNIFNIFCFKGCGGGNPDEAFEYINDQGGIDTESSYPYEGVDDSSCRYNPSNIGATDVGYGYIKSGEEDDLKSAIALEVAINPEVLLDHDLIL